MEIPMIREKEMDVHYENFLFHSLDMYRFLELAQLHANQEDVSTLLHYQVQGSYDSELMQLQESFQGKIVHLLSDTVCITHCMYEMS